MTLTVGFSDGFDHYLDMTTSPLGFGSQWNGTAHVGGVFTFVSPGFRGRGKGVHMIASAGGVLGTASRYLRGFPSVKQISQHVAIRIDALNTDTPCPILGWFDVNNACQFSLYTMPAGFYGLYRGFGTTLLATSNDTIQNGIVHRLNMAFDFTNPISGTADLWIDGDHAKGFTLAGVDLLATAQVDVRAVSLEQANLSYKYTVDDYMFCYGAAQNIGEMELVTQGPTADVQKNWTPLTGTDNYAMVDEIPPDGDTSYNSSTVVGNLDLQSFPALPVTPDSIFCLTQIIGARKEESGTRGINPVAKVSGVEHDGTEQNVTTDYVWYYQHYLQNPETAAAWLVAERTASSFGYKDAL